MKASTCSAPPSPGPLISKRLVEIADETGADAVAHGATGKGNDQVRFELGLCAQPGHQGHRALARLGFQVRTDLIQFAEAHQIPVAKDKRGEAPFSVDANLLHSSSEGKVLEDPAEEAPNMSTCARFRRRMRRTRPTIIKIGFEKGDAVSINGER
jgi:argininosuccinate synthase